MYHDSNYYICHGKSYTSISSKNATQCRRRHGRAHRVSRSGPSTGLDSEQDDQVTKLDLSRVFTLPALVTLPALKIIAWQYRAIQFVLKGLDSACQLKWVLNRTVDELYEPP